MPGTVIQIDPIPAADGAMDQLTVPPAPSPMSYASTTAATLAESPRTTKLDTAPAEEAAEEEAAEEDAAPLSPKARPELIDESGLPELTYDFTIGVDPSLVLNPSIFHDPESGLRPAMNLIQSSQPSHPSHMRSKSTDQKPRLPKVEPLDATALEGHKLSLDWVYGWRSRDTRNCLVATPSGCLAVPAGPFLVVLALKTNSQKHIAHASAVTCATLHPGDPDIVATAQLASVVEGRAVGPKIIFQNLRSQKSTPLPALHRRGVRALSFTENGRLLASLGADSNSTVVVWDPDTRKPLAQTRAGGDAQKKVLHLCWKDYTELLTVGVRHICFWDFDGVSLKPRMPELPQPLMTSDVFLCCTYSHVGEAIIGATDGCVYVFERHHVRRVRLHQGPVLTLLRHHGHVLSGGADETVSVLDAGLHRVNTINVGGAVRSLAPLSERRLAIGTATGEVVSVADYTKRTSPLEGLMEPHSHGPLVLDVSPVNPHQFVTCGDDERLVIWEGKSHSVLKVLVLRGAVPLQQPPRPSGDEEPDTARTFKLRSMSCWPGPRVPARIVPTAISYSQDGAAIILALDTLEVLVLSEAQLTPLAHHSLLTVVGEHAGNGVTAIRPSPCGRYVALSFVCGAIVLCVCADDYAPLVCLRRGATEAPVRHLDWASDSRTLRAANAVGELLYVQLEKDDLRQSLFVSPQDLKGVEWAGVDCLWMNALSCPVTASHALPKESVVLLGDSSGHLSVAKYSEHSSGLGRDPVTVPGHFGSVSSVRIMPGVGAALSAGASDQTVLQWSFR